MHRIKVISGHLSPYTPEGWNRNVNINHCGARATVSGPEDVVVVHGRRTAIGKAKRGLFKVWSFKPFLNSVFCTNFPLRPFEIVIQLLHNSHDNPIGLSVIMFVLKTTNQVPRIAFCACSRYTTMLSTMA